jgi:hypothetical protein
MMKTTQWKTAPISPTCEVMRSHKPERCCDAPTTYAYPAMGQGWMALCFKHAQKHLKHGGAVHVDILITRGEKWA